MHALTVDLEDWFHFLDLDSTADPARWPDYESHVERMTYGLLDFLSERKQLATFFTLGWVAEQFPTLIRHVADQGHEIACHSHHHPLIYKLTPEAFEADLVCGLNAIEAASGIRPTAFRAPGFSITPTCLWAFDILAKHKISTDSSVFPAKRAHGGLPGAPLDPFVIETPHGEIVELPLTTASLLGRPFVFSGGGYFRLIPRPLLRRLFAQAEAKGAPAMTYFHPRDFYNDTPIPELPPHRRFKATVGLSQSFTKLGDLIKDGGFDTVAAYEAALDRANLQRRTTKTLLTA